MYLACEAVGRYVLPIFRSLVAKELIEKYNFTQIEAAKRLGTTQAAISQYLHSKRGHKAMAQFKEVLPTIQVVATEIAKGIATGKMNIDEVSLNFCKVCMLLREGKKIPK